MLARHMTSGSYFASRSPGPCYTELHNVDITSISTLIANSTNMCLPDSLGESSCGSEYGYPHHYRSSESSPCSGPHSGYQEDLHDIHHILQKDRSRSIDDDDDSDSSVMLDIQDLAFLDKVSKDSNRREEYHMIPHAHTAYPSEHSHYDELSAHYDSAAVTSAPRYSRPTPTTWTCHHGYTDVIGSHPAARGVFPPTPSPSLSPSPRLRDDTLPTRTMSDDEDDDDEDDEYKPYCDSRRGAKKNLLWKFLLWVLDNHTDLAQWTDVKRGVFKFVDTARVSRMWGQRKHKKDMTFEKLSRGIRHYYKRGLMERLANTRLVYKFNWEKVPRKHRKA